MLVKAEKLLSHPVFAHWMTLNENIQNGCWGVSDNQTLITFSFLFSSLNTAFQCVARGFCIDVWSSGKTEEESIEVLMKYREMSRKSSGAALVLSPSLSPSPPSLSPSLPPSTVSSISRPLLYLPLASHCRALRKARTPSDKVRMIHVLFSVWIWAMLKYWTVLYTMYFFSLIEYLV